MSLTFLRYCPDSECQFYTNFVYADFEQIKKHLWTHSYKELLQTARELNLIPEHATPNKHFLVESLARLSRVGEN